MKDSRLDQLAKLMLEYSIKAQPQEIVLLNTDITALPLAKAIMRRANEMGVFVVPEITTQETIRLAKEGLHTDDDCASERFLEKKTSWGLARAQDIACLINLRAYQNDQELSAIPPAIHNMEGRIVKPLQDLLIDERRWVLFEYPTPGQAQRAGIAYEKYFDFVFDVSNVDYAKMAEDVKPLVSLMERTDRVRIVGPETDLRFSIKNIPIIPCCGEANIPDGEVFTAPVRDSINGTLKFNTPTLYWGKIMTGVKLEFENGKIIKATADTNEKTLNKILDSDEGARYVGEFALGINPLIREPFLNTLFDEKICGSFHFTPGKAYAEADNGNTSTIHWDMVCIQRPEYGGGEIWFDDVMVRKDGMFILPELIGLNP